MGSFTTFENIRFTDRDTVKENLDYGDYSLGSIIGIILFLWLLIAIIFTLVAYQMSFDKREC